MTCTLRLASYAPKGKEQQAMKQQKAMLIALIVICITVVVTVLVTRKDLCESLFRILCKYLFSEVAVQAVTELDNKAAHCHTPVPQWHRPFL